MEQPAPSPAPTLDDHFPGFYPPTPSVQESSDPTPAVSADHAALEHEAEANRHRLEGAGVALLGAAAGFVVGGPLGAAVGGGLAGLSAVEHQGITEMALADDPKHSSTTTSAAATESKNAAAVQLDTHQAFGTPAVEKEQAELAHSPAQQLLNNKNNEDRHLGEALLAGAAGAKLASNEVEEPSTTANTKQAAVPVSESQMTTPTATTPNFGTPAVEKSQAELAHSPAQRLLAGSASSTSAATPPLSAEAALLGAAAAGATSVGKVENEIEEPATVPVDEAVEKDLQAGAGIPTNLRGTSGNEILTATPLDNENESSDRPSLPTPSGSLDSFSGAVLAAGSGIETPTIAPGPAASGFGTREPGTILLTDREIDQSAVDGPRESSNEMPLAAAASVPLPVDTPSARSDVSIAGSDETETPRERNPFHLGEAAPLAAGGAALAGVAALAGPESVDKDAPKDFEPYPPPSLPEQVETPGSETDASSLSKLDEAPMFTAQDKGKGKAVDEALAVAAAGGGGVGMAVGMKSFSNDLPAETAPRTSSTFTENFDTPPVSATMAPAPLWDQRAEPPSTAAVESLQHGEPHRAVDPRELAATAGTATSPEQAGFVGVAPGVGPTPAMQEFAHLPQPAPNAQQEAAALDESTPAATQEQRSNAVPFAAAAGLAGAGAGAAGATMLARQSSGVPVSTPGRAPAPVSRFREDAAYTPSPAAAENTTPGSTRPVMGSPAQGMPQQQQQQQMPPPPHLQQQQQQQQGAIPPHLAAQQQPQEPAATIERSPHMKITTAVVDGHKRLHRKSLSKGSPRSSQFSTTELERPASVAGSTGPASFAPGQQQQPMQHPVQPAAHPQAHFAVPPQQQHQQAPVPSNAAMSGPTGFAGARPNVPAGDAEARRDRMMDSMVGVRDPLVSGPVVGATAPVRPPSMGTTSPTASSPSSPLAPPHPNRMESDSSGVGQRHNETHAGVPPTALGVTAVTTAAIPGMGTLPPVGGMPIPPHHQQQHQQQHQGERSGPGVAPPSAVAPVEHTTGVQRKLSKRNPHEPGVDKERKEGFFHKLFGGGGSRHSRNASASSRNSANASPRVSADIPRQ